VDPWICHVTDLGICHVHVVGVDPRICHVTDLGINGSRATVEDPRIRHRVVAVITHNVLLVLVVVLVMLQTATIAALWAAWTTQSGATEGSTRCALGTPFNAFSASRTCRMRRRDGRCG